MNKLFEEIRNESDEPLAQEDRILLETFEDFYKYQ
jgi:hypothetical protein